MNDLRTFSRVQSPRIASPQQEKKVNNNMMVSSPSLKDCDPEKNFLLQKHGYRGIIVAACVLTVAFLVIIISRWNEVRQQKVPMIWRNRLKAMIKDSANSLTMSREASTPGTALKYAIEANTTLSNARKLAGTVDLAALSGYDIAKLESEVETILRRTISHDLLVKDTDIVGPSNTSRPSYTNNYENRSLLRGPHNLVS